MNKRSEFDPFVIGVGDKLVLQSGRYTRQDTMVDKRCGYCGSNKLGMHFIVTLARDNLMRSVNICPACLTRPEMVLLMLKEGTPHGS